MGWRPTSVATALLVLAASAHAGDEDFAAVVASGNLARAEVMTESMGEADRRCALGVIAIARADWARGFALVDGCVPQREDLADQARRARRRARRALEAGAFAPVAIVVEPSPQPVVISSFGELRIETPAELWLPFGTHRVALVGERDGQTVVVDDRSRRTVIVHRAAPLRAPRESEVDFSDETAADGSGVVGDPEKLRYRTLLPERYRKRRARTASPDRPVPAAPWAVELGIGAGMSRLTGTSDVVASYRLALGALRRIGAVLVRAELGALGKGASIDGSAQRIHGVALTLGVAGQVALGGGWRLEAGAGPEAVLPIRDRVAGRDLAGVEANVVVTGGASRRLGSRHWLQLGVRLGHGVNALVDGLGRSQQALATIGVSFE